MDTLNGAMIVSTVPHRVAHSLSGGRSPNVESEEYSIGGVAGRFLITVNNLFRSDLVMTTLRRCPAGDLLYLFGTTAKVPPLRLKSSPAR